MGLGAVRSFAWEGGKERQGGNKTLSTFPNGQKLEVPDNFAVMQERVPTQWRGG